MKDKALNACDDSNATFQYKDFGVDIDEGNGFVGDIRPIVTETFTPSVLGGLGGFSGCFTMPKGFKNPVICATTDGVGSKLTLASKYGMLGGIGIDLVAMCVNDLICDFAEPMFFLDYYATHKLVRKDSLMILKSIAEGCKMAKCSLIGGESAEMPSVYNKGDFDLAGFCVGIAEEEDIKRRDKIKQGDVIVGISSSGFHSNGYSLIRGIIDAKRIDVFEKIGDRRLLDLILEPTTIYVDHFLSNMDKLKGLAHITGGGLCENLVRVLGNNVVARIDKEAIEILDVFKVFTKYVDEAESFRVFNMGIGMVFIVDKNDVDSVIYNVGLHNSRAYVIGHIGSGDREVILE